MTGFERVKSESEFTRLMIQAVKDHKELSDAIDHCNEAGYAISFSFINGMCWATLDTAKNTRKRIMES